MAHSFTLLRALQECSKIVAGQPWEVLTNKFRLDFRVVVPPASEYAVANAMFVLGSSLLRARDRCRTRMASALQPPCTQAVARWKRIRRIEIELLRGRYLPDSVTSS